jgi:hypothetical protein
VNPGFAIYDAVHGGGNEHFYWLPPMITPMPTFSGVFDGAADPAVQICEWSGTACIGDPVLTITATSGLTVNTVDGWYGADWYVFDHDAAEGDVFRISVSASAQELGFADLMIVDKVTGQLKKTLGEEYLLLSENNGKKFLKLRFRIEDGATTSEIAWSLQASGTTAPLFEVWASSPTDVYAVGNEAVILRSDGLTWTQQVAPGLPIDFEFRALSGIPGLSHDVIAGGCSNTQGANIWHFNGTDWVALGAFLPGVNPKHGCVRGLSEGYFGLIVGNHLNLEGRIWTPTVHNTIVPDWTGVQNTALQGVWGTSYEGTGFAVGINGLILRNDGNGWVQQGGTGTPPALQSVWGSSVQDVFAVGESGLILHYDGQAWTPQSSGTTADLFEVWGSSASDVYAVGRAGAVLHYDGNTWSSVDVGVTDVLFGVWVSSNGSTVYIVGDNGLILKGEK